MQWSLCVPLLACTAHEWFKCWNWIPFGVISCTWAFRSEMHIYIAHCCIYKYFTFGNVSLWGVYDWTTSSNLNLIWNHRMIKYDLECSDWAETLTIVNLNSHFRQFYWIFCARFIPMSFHFIRVSEHGIWDLDYVENVTNFKSH